MCLWSQNSEQIKPKNRTDDCADNCEGDLPRPLLAGFVQRVIFLFHGREEDNGLQNRRAEPSRSRTQPGGRFVKGPSFVHVVSTGG